MKDHHEGRGKQSAQDKDNTVAKSISITLYGKESAMGRRAGRALARASRLLLETKWHAFLETQKDSRTTLDRRIKARFGLCRRKIETAVGGEPVCDKTRLLLMSEFDVLLYFEGEVGPPKPSGTVSGKADS